MQPAPAHISYGSQIFAWVRNAPAFWQWFAFLFPATTAAVTSVIARLQDVPVPWHLVIFYSLGVFCFAIFATVTLIKMKWEMTLKYKLTCATIVNLSRMTYLGH